MKTSTWRAVPLLAAAVLLAPSVRAGPATAQASLSVTNLQITPSSGSVVFLPWSASTFTDANGTAGFDSTADGLTPAASAATSPYASASGQAMPVGLSLAADASVAIPDAIATLASATARSTLSAVFQLVGGVGPVDVTFSADPTGSLSVATTSLGLQATADTVFSLELDGTPILFRADTLSIGPADSDAQIFSPTLTAHASLQFDTPYFVLTEADAETRAATTVPDGDVAWFDLVIVVIAAGLVSRRMTAARPL